MTGGELLKEEEVVKIGVVKEAVRKGENDIVKRDEKEVVKRREGIIVAANITEEAVVRKDTIVGIGIGVEAGTNLCYLKKKNEIFALFILKLL